MPPSELEGKNLGEKHKLFNKLVKEAKENKTVLDFDEHNTEENDIQNLVNIDVANENRNVNYIISILTCSDLLYIKRALKKCDWLICDEQYADIMNPKNLNCHLYPQMQTKAINKLKHLIRLKIQCESRAEQFYNDEQKSSDALKWLPKCSLKFIETNLHKHTKEMNISVLKRLCEKSIKVLELYINCYPYDKKKALENTLFLLHYDANKFLDIVETQTVLCYPVFGKRATKLLMTKCQKGIDFLRVLQQFTPVYYWYQFTTFDLAFSKIKNMIGPETDTYDKNDMFVTLIASAKGNSEHGKNLLKYFRDKHINSSLTTKITFLNSFINNFETYRFDKDNWTIFENIINSVNVYDNSESSNIINEAILVYKILHNESISSLLAIYYNLSVIQCQESLSDILNTPVSLQKHGIRCVFSKLSSDKLMKTFDTLWKNTKNSTIRTEIFKITFNLLCNEKNEDKINDTWNLLEMFIDNLNFQENKTTYQLLYNIDKIPKRVQAQYFIKSYKFLKTLIANNQKEYSGPDWDIKKLVRYSRNIIASLPSDFIAEIIREFINSHFFKEKIDMYNMTNLISSYLLYAKDEETQMEKFNDILAPVLKRSIELWKEYHRGEYHVRLNLEKLMLNLINDLKHFTVEENIVIPVKMFSMIQIELQRSLPLSENYILIRTWQLATEFATLLQQNQPIVWEETCLQIAPEFGKICVDLLRKDTATLFSCIYIHFTRILDPFKYILSYDVQYEIYTSFIQDKSFTHGYLAALKLIKSLRGNEIRDKVRILREEISKYPSVEVKIHYYQMFPEDRVYLFASSKNG